MAMKRLCESQMERPTAAGPECRAAFDFLGSRHDHTIADPPSADILGEGDHAIARLAGCAEFYPRPAHRRTMRIPSPAAVDNRRQRLAVHPLEIREPDR